MQRDDASPAPPDPLLTPDAPTSLFGAALPRAPRLPTFADRVASDVLSPADFTTPAGRARAFDLARARALHVPPAGMDDGGDFEVAAPIADDDRPDASATEAPVLAALRQSAWESQKPLGCHDGITNTEAQPTRGCLAAGIGAEACDDTPAVESRPEIPPPPHPPTVPCAASPDEDAIRREIVRRAERFGAVLRHGRTLTDAVVLLDVGDGWTAHVEAGSPDFGTDAPEYLWSVAADEKRTALERLVSMIPPLR